MTQKDFKKLHEISLQGRILSGISSLLQWDQETYMPEGASGIRAEQLKLLAGLIHKEKTGSKFAKALGKLIDIPTGQVVSEDLSAPQKAALREWRRDFLRDTALPAKFVKDLAKLSSQAQLVWRDAKKDNAFHRFAPYLEKMVAMNRKAADYLKSKDHPYDALLDYYEPEATSKEIGALFTKLQGGISALLKKIQAAEPIDDKALHGEFSPDLQLNLGKRLLDAIGYDMLKGRLDTSSHPFSSASHPDDSRITTRFLPDSLVNNLSTVLHEAGHGMYEMGLPAKEYGTPLSEAVSLGVHESQSRWWETRIGHSKPFWSFFLPIIQNEFGQYKNLNVEEVYKAVNKVTPSLIRVEADEVTYPLHVILRFELEKAMVEGSLKVRELPEAWNSKMKEYLGIVPPDNRSGCLQDVHWSMGLMGYFPTYALGNMYAAQFFKKFTEDHPDWETKVSQGEFQFMKDWLAKQVYQYGRQYTPHELIQHVAKQPFSEEPYLEYLGQKYRQIYKF